MFTQHECMNQFASKCTFCNLLMVLNTGSNGAASRMLEQRKLRSAAWGQSLFYLQKYPKKASIFPGTMTLKLANTAVPYASRQWSRCLLLDMIITTSLVGELELIINVSIRALGPLRGKSKPTQ